MAEDNHQIRQKERLLNTLRQFFGGILFHAGKEFLASQPLGTINILDTSSPQKIRIQADISDEGVTHKTSLTFITTSQTFSHSRCTCPYQWTTCKHSAALGIEFIQNIESLLTTAHVFESTDNAREKSTQTLEKKQSIHINTTSLFADTKGHHHQQRDTKNNQNALYAVLHLGFTLRIEFFIHGKEMWNSWPLSPSSILKHYSQGLSKQALKLLRHVESQTIFDTPKEIQELLLLFQASKLDLFVNERSHTSQIRFVAAREKIKASLSLQTRFLDGTDTTECIFQIQESLHAIDKVTSFFGDTTLFLFHPLEGTILIHTLTPRIRKLCSRIAQQERDHANFFMATTQRSIKLSDDEIIHLNEIIVEAKSCLNLTTALEPHFIIQESKKSQEVIAVHYDNLTHALEIQAHVDYGTIQIDVSKTVYRNAQDPESLFTHSKHPADKKYHTRIDGNIIHYARIQEDKEIALFASLYTQSKLGFNKKMKNARQGSEAIAQFYATHWPHVKNLGHEIKYTKHIFDFIETNFTADVHVDMNAKNDWLSFDADLYCGDDKISLEDLQQFIQNPDACMRMKDGRMVKIANMHELERFVTILKSFRRNEQDRFEGALYHAPELDHFLSQSEYYTTTCNARFKKFLQEAQDGKPIESIALTKNMDTTLRKYQKDGVAWMKFLQKYGFAGILADDMGLGKTIQTLTLLDMDSQTLPSMVICPKTLLFNWEQEAKTFFPHIKTYVIEGTPTERHKKILSIHKHDLIITSYPSIKKDFQFYEKHGVHFQYCLIDEAQFMKNHKTQNAKTVKKINANYRLALTGTPLENNVSEIWSIFDFLMPGFLGTYAEFSKRYLLPIMKHNDARVLEELRKKVSCFMLRRTKENVLKELPTKIEQVVSCELDDAQTLLYQEILAKVKKNIFSAVSEHGYAKSHIHILAGLTKLRQICNHPALLLKDADYEQYSSSKLKMFEELVDEIVSSNRKVLVFSQFTRMLDILQKTLQKKGIDHLYLSGKTKNRKALVDEFNTNDKMKVFLISLKAGGTGLNLTSADNVIIFDPWWNMSVENQAIDRAYRMGQTKSVNVYRIVTKGTIEEKIIQLQKKKQFLFNTLVSESQDLFQTITWDDIKSLFEIESEA